MAVAGCGEAVAPSWYDGGWPQEGEARKKSPVDYRDWYQEQEAATSSKDGVNNCAH